MKIEKLTENKIRVIIKTEEFKDSDVDFNSILEKTTLTQNLFLEILDKAEKKFNFHTDGCRLLIELFSSVDEVLVFTITKYEVQNTKDIQPYNKTIKKKNVTPKIKSIDYSNKQIIYAFNNIEEFCNFCSHINTLKEFKFKEFSKHASLFLYNNTYYLVIKKINIKYKHTNSFYSLALEFGKLLSTTENFESKLIEHGNIIIKRNAIDIGIKYFV